MTFCRKIANLLFVGLSNIFRKNGHAEFISEKNAGQLLPHFLSHRLFSKSLDKIHFIAQKNDSLLAIKMFADSKILENLSQ